MTWTMRALFGLLVAGAVAAAGMVVSRWQESAPWVAAPTRVTPPPLSAEAFLPSSRLVSESLSIRRGDTLAELLGRAGVDAAGQVEMIAAIRKAFDVRKLRAGSELTLTRLDSGALRSIHYLIDPDHELRVARTGDAFSAAVVEVPGVIRAVSVCGEIHGSLFESIERTGERAELALPMAEIFAWDLDFYTDPREGDEFCLVVEKKEYLNGQAPTYQRILAARYVNSGTPYEGYLFPDEDGKPQYYAPDGRSLQAAFLRSPMKFEARVSSRFTHRRLHPVLKIYRPHLGTDYAAPTGTPVQAVASGRVTFSGWSGGAGNLIKIQHSDGFETMYLHLSRRFVRSGQRVQQGQRIGLVGATGLATGPHLDFRVRKKGRYLDFEKMKPPRATKIGPDRIASFAAERERLAVMLEPGYETDMLLAGGPPASEGAVVD